MLMLTPHPTQALWYQLGMQAVIRPMQSKVNTNNKIKTPSISNMICFFLLQVSYIPHERLLVCLSGISII